MSRALSTRPTSAGHDRSRSCRPRCQRTIGAVVAGIAAVAAFAVSVTAHAQPSAYPTRPVRMLVGFVAGGPTDIIARVVGAKFSETFGHQFVVENRSGASGNIATEAAARAEPDGHTLLVTLMSGAVNESLFPDFKYKFSEHFEPIGALADTGLVLLVHPSLEVKSVADLVALARAKPGDVFYATAGKGTATHLAAELFTATAGIRMTPVHYKGGGETVRELLSGQVKVMFSTIPPVLSFVRDGRLRGIATTPIGGDRSLPDLPTIDKAGLPGFDVRLWFGIGAPKGTPKAVIDRLAGALKEILASEDTQKKFAAQGFAPMTDMTPEAFGAFYRAEAAKWAKVVAAVSSLRD